MNGWNGRQYFSSWSPRFGFFVYPTRTHSTLEKPGAQNIGAFGNQGKQHVLSNHWKSIKTFLEKKWQGRSTEIQVLTRDFTFYKIRYTVNILI